MVESVEFSEVFREWLQVPALEFMSPSLLWLIKLLIATIRSSETWNHTDGTHHDFGIVPVPVALKQ